VQPFPARIALTLKLLVATIGWLLPLLLLMAACGLKMLPLLLLPCCRSRGPVAATLASVLVPLFEVLPCCALQAEVKAFKAGLRSTLLLLLLHPALLWGLDEGAAFISCDLKMRLLRKVFSLLLNALVTSPLPELRWGRGEGGLLRLC
jgi:hypothetical protein